MTVAEGLEVTNFAHEPMMFKPANIDVDADGRVWVCEGVNYRKWSNLRKEGDRILILEDTDRQPARPTRPPPSTRGPTSTAPWASACSATR